MDMNVTTIKDIRAYGAFMSEGAARSLTLLQAIDNMVAGMATIAEQARSFTTAVNEMSAGIPRLTVAIPEDEIVPAYEALQDDLVKLHSMLRAQCHRVDNSPAFRKDDGVCEGYRTNMGAIRDLHDALETFRCLILEHNADLDPAGTEVMTDASEIERYLASL